MTEDALVKQIGGPFAGQYMYRQIQKTIEPKNGPYKESGGRHTLTSILEGTIGS